MMLFWRECVIACLLFTALVKCVGRGREQVFENDYPPIVTERLRKAGKIAEKPPTRTRDIVRKLIAMLLLALICAWVLVSVNGISDYATATATAYGLWLVVAWYDFFAVDILLMPFDRFYRESGVSAFDLRSVWFHFQGSLRGTMLGLLFAPIVGGLVALL